MPAPARSCASRGGPRRTRRRGAPPNAPRRSLSRRQLHERSRGSSRQRIPPRGEPLARTRAATDPQARGQRAAPWSCATPSGRRTPRRRRRTPRRKGQARPPRRPPPDRTQRTEGAPAGPTLRRSRQEPQAVSAPPRRPVRRGLRQSGAPAMRARARPPPTPRAQPTRRVQPTRAQLPRLPGTATQERANPSRPPIGSAPGGPEAARYCRE